MKIKILYEDNHLLVVVKPINVPVQADSSHDEDLLSILKLYLKDKYKKPGNVYLGLVHRLDRPVGGVMVFAKTSKAASRISEQIRNNLMKKEYYAIVIGKTQKHDRYLDYLLKLDNNITVVSENGKEAILDYQLIDYKDGLSLVKINLETGRSHQIRVQFSHHGHPLYGDQKYNNLINKKAQICLFASSLSLKHPITNQVITFTEPVPCNYPWNIFKI